MLFDILSHKHKTVPTVKEEVETINFNHYRNAKGKKSYQGGNGVNPSNRQGRLMLCFKYNSAKHFTHDCTGSRNDINYRIMHCFKCNSAQHFVYDCTGLRNNINTVMNSDQIHFTLFDMDTNYQNIINESNIKISKLVKETLGMAVLDSAYFQRVARKL